MTLGRAIVVLALAAILGIPLVLGSRRDTPPPGDDALTLIVITPHVRQIQQEFAEAFDRWHRREHGRAVRIDYRRPGGTSEILKQLQAQFNAALASGRYDTTPDGRVVLHPGAITFDVMFGGGSYDHTRLKTGDGVSVTLPSAAAPVPVPMSNPAGVDQRTLDEWYGDNAIGSGLLYDPDQYWLGTALSSFGIVYNRDTVHRLLGRHDLETFDELADPRLAGWIALADPRQSGSITTTFDAILSRYGWDDGWRLLRAMCANTRYFTNSSTKPPIDVSQGEAAAGLAIDFYGRTQAQVVTRPDETPETSRVGYADPPGAVFVDADPVSILNGAPSPDLARRFVEFCLTDEGQALWNFHAVTTPAGASNPPGPDARPLGPTTHELRRMPVRRDFYDRYAELLIDKVNPFDIASTTPSAGWRSAIGLMMGAFAVDNLNDIRAAWLAMHRARDRGAPPESLAEMERLFYAFPEPDQVAGLWRSLFGDAEPRCPDDALLPFTPENYRVLRGAWRDPAVLARLRIVYTSAFRENYRAILRIAEEQH
ncbi:MAG: extracellular solute-binding protein [Phycisphaeraceae bacterium]|nr:extracellular solute-binding protein [Phycisphaeraceae bacterium]